MPEAGSSWPSWPKASQVEFPTHVLAWIHQPLEGEKSSYFYMWVARIVTVTGLVHETLEVILERFADETFLCLKRRSRGTCMNTWGFKIRHHSSLEWNVAVHFGSCLVMTLLLTRTTPVTTGLFKRNVPRLKVFCGTHEALHRAQQGLRFPTLLACFPG